MRKRITINGQALFFAVLVSAFTPSSGLHAQTIEYLFFELSPLLHLRDGAISGPVALRAQTVFEQAKLDTNIVADLPVRRVLALLKDPVPNRCSAGWFKNEARLKDYQFSQPFYTDTAQIILSTKKSKAVIESHSTLRSLMADTSLTMGAINGLSYGEFFDELAVALKTPRYLVQNYEQVYMMLASGRVDYIISDPLEVTALPDPTRITPEEFSATAFKDAPAGEKRYIICSKATPQAIMKAINIAITQIDK